MSCFHRIALHTDYETTVVSLKAARKCSFRFSSRSSLCDHLIPAVKPPSTTRACPVTKLDSLLASQSAAFAISAGSPALPIGVSDASHGFTISGVRSTSSAGISGHTGAQIHVAVPPGQIALTLIPRSASSKATDFVNPTTPNFAAV